MGSPNERRRDIGGFTLIELMIVVVVLAVLLGIALPAYQNQIIRGHRAAAKAELLEIANRQEQYLLANRAYAPDLSDLSYTVPPDVLARYTFEISSVTAAPYFKLEATPQGAQSSDVDKLSVDSRGVKLPADKWKR